ncbi:MAG: small multi-drug export protein [Clostridia bacterium]
MVETLVQSIISLFGGFLTVPFGKEIVVFIISLMPILELRGGLIAAALLKLDPFFSYFVSIVGNLLPIPFILLFITKIFEWLRKFKKFNKLVTKLEEKALSKKEQLEKGEFIGLVLFVGIPLPGTGAWTGALIAALIGMNRKKAMLAITLGVILASIIMMILSFGVIGTLIA